ncbi:MAG: sensor histidine kinase [uncultured bacterium]|nr:MAG: sensor histidine kinase [uncultured bacterium]
MELSNLLAVLYFAGGIFMVVLAVAFLFEEVKKINLISLAILFLSGWWSFGYYLWLTTKLHSFTDISFGVSNLGLIFGAVTYYFWITVLLDKKRKMLVYTGYLVAIIFSLFYIFNLKAGNLEIFSRSSWGGAIFASYFILVHIGFYVLTVTELIDSILSSRDKEAKFIDRNILLISSLIAILEIFSLPALYGTEYFLYSGVVAVFLIFSLFIYVSIKKKLIDIKIFFAQTLIGLILTVNIAEIFFSKTFIGVAYRLVMLLFLFIFANLLIKKYKQDVSQKNELEKMGKKLEANNRKLKELDNAKNEFISIAAHQLRTPPTVIKGYLALAKEDPNNNLDAETRDSLSRAFTSNERLIELVEDILNISRIESGKMQYDIQPDQSCEKIIRDLTETFEIKARDKGLAFKLEIPKDKVPDIRMDSGKIREVISNLIDNAIKYTLKGFITLRLIKTDYDMVRIEISDTGMGISEHEMGNLFKKFSRGSNADQLATGGIGLGIYVGRKIIEAHKGKIWAQSVGVGKGSTFIIELPIG